MSRNPAEESKITIRRRIKTMTGKYRYFGGLRYEIWDFVPRTKAEASKKAKTFRERGGKARVVKTEAGWYIYIRGK